VQAGLNSLVLSAVAVMLSCVIAALPVVLLVVAPVCTAGHPARSALAAHSTLAALADRACRCGYPAGRPVCRPPGGFAAHCLPDTSPFSNPAAACVVGTAIDIVLSTICPPLVPHLATGLGTGLSTIATISCGYKGQVALYRALSRKCNSNFFHRKSRMKTSTSSVETRSFPGSHFKYFLNKRRA
jgi:hypothetical protein